MNLTVLAAVVWCWLAFGYLYAIFGYIINKRLRSKMEEAPLQAIISFMISSVPIVLFRLIIPLIIHFLLRLTGHGRRKDKE